MLRKRLNFFYSEKRLIQCVTLIYKPPMESVNFLSHFINAMNNVFFFTFSYAQIVEKVLFFSYVFTIAFLMEL